RTIAATGGPAPDGGIFAAFAYLPVMSRSGAVGFIASIDGAPSPLAVYLAGRAGLKRLAGIGDTLPNGGRLAAFPRHPTLAIGPDDAVTFAAAGERDGKRTDILLYSGP